MQFRLPLSKAVRVVKEAMKIAEPEYVTADELDCEKSFRRQPTDKTPKEVFEMASRKGTSTAWNFIIRDDHPFPVVDIGCCTGVGVVYFLWIHIPVDKALELARKHKLKEL